MKLMMLKEGVIERSGGSTVTLMMLKHQGLHPKRSQWRIYYEANDAQASGPPTGLPVGQYFCNVKFSTKCNIFHKEYIIFIEEIYFLGKCSE